MLKSGSAIFCSPVDPPRTESPASRTGHRPARSQGPRVELPRLYRCGGAEQKPRPARLQQIAVLRQTFVKQHRLIMPARIGQTDNAHLAAALGAPFGA